MTPTRAIRAAFTAAGVSFAAAGALASGIDPSLPAVVHVGAPPAPAPVDRLDVARTGRSRLPLPESPVETGRRTVGASAQIPVVHADGGMTVALAAPEILRLGPDGAELGRTRLGTSPAARAPVVTSGGGVAVLTTAPSVVFLSRAGKIVSTVPLSRTAFPVGASGASASDGFSSIAPTSDGAVVVASGASIVEVDASGHVRLSATLPDRERIAADLVQSPAGWIVPTQSGAIFAVRPPAAPKKIGSFGAPVTSGPVLAGGRALVAQVGSGRVAALDLVTGAVVTHVVETSLFSFDGAFVLDGSGGLWITTSEGVLVGVDKSGAEVQRVGIDRAAAPVVVTGGGRGVVAAPPVSTRTVLLVDPDGRVAFARSGGRVGVRGADGTVRIAPERACATPTAILPMAKTSFAVVCREGTVILYGEAAKSG